MTQDLQSLQDQIAHLKRENEALRAQKDTFKERLKNLTAEEDLRIGLTIPDDQLQDLEDTSEPEWR